MVLQESIKRLSERERKLIASLRIAKYRTSEGLFVAEGEKSIGLLRQHYKLRWLVTTSEQPPVGYPLECLRRTTSQELKKLSSLKSVQDFIAIFEIPAPPTLPDRLEGLSVALDEVQNPGNMGTIIRLCDWLGIRHIFCSKGCVDPYNEKCVQASMGALGNVEIHQECDLKTLLPQLFKRIIATSMEGEDYREIDLPLKEPAVVILGNEGHGLSAGLLDIATESITIPKAPSSVSDSLNVALSAAILLSSLTQ